MGSSVAFRDAGIADGVKKIVEKVKVAMKNKMATDPSFGPKVVIAAIALSGAASFIASLVLGKVTNMLLTKLMTSGIVKAIKRGELTEEKFMSSYKEEFNKAYKETEAEIIRQFGAEARDPAVMAKYMEGLDYSSIMHAHSVAELYNITGDPALRRISKAFDEVRTSPKLDHKSVFDSLELMCKRMPGAKYCANKYSRKRAVRDAMHKAGYMYALRDSKRIVDAIKDYDIKYNAKDAANTISNLKEYSILNKLYDPQTLSNYISDLKTIESKFSNNLPSHEYSSMQLTIAKIIKGLLHYKKVNSFIASNDFFKRVDWITSFLVNLIHDINAFNRQTRTSELRVKLSKYLKKDNAMMRYDRMYRDGVIEIAKDKVKNAIASTKKFAKDHPRLTAALGGLLAALGTGSAIAIRRAMSKARPEIIDVKFEWIGPEDGTEKSKVSDKLKDAFKWAKKAEESFDDKFSKFNPKVKADSRRNLMRRDRYVLDGVIDTAKEKVKRAIERVKQFKGKHPRLVKALGALLAAITAGSVVAIVKAKKAIAQAQDVEYISPERAEQMDFSKIREGVKTARRNERYEKSRSMNEELGRNMNDPSNQVKTMSAQYKDLVRDVFAAADNAKSALKEKAAQVKKSGKISPRPTDIVIDSRFGRRKLRRVKDAPHSNSLGGAYKAASNLPVAAALLISRVKPVQKKLDMLAEKLSEFATKHPKVAKLVRIIIKIVSTLGLIREGINVAVMNTYLHNVVLLGQEGLDITNKLTGLDVDVVFDWRLAPASKKNIFIATLLGLKSALKVLLSILGIYISKHLKPMPENAIRIENEA